MTTVPRTETEQRVARVQARMAAANPAIDALILVQTADLYYLSGTAQTAHLIVPATGEPRLLVRKILDRAQEDSPLADIRPLGSMKDLAGHLDELCGTGTKRVGLELDVLPVNTLRFYEKILGSGVETVDGSPAVLACRAVKSEYEIDQLREAGRVHSKICEAIVEELSSGAELSTYQLGARLDLRARELGHCGVIRMRGLNVEAGIGTVVSGEDGAIPSHSVFPIGGRGPHPYAPLAGSHAPIENDVPIISDYLINLTGYHSDCTRMAVRGTFPDEAAEILAVMQSLLRHCESTVRAGVIPSAVYQDVVERATEAGLGENFMGPGKLGVSFIGHSVGLEVNETPVLAPRFDEPLEVGNTIAIEPKYTHARFGVIGLENTYAVREDGLELLTEASEDVVVVPA